VKRIGIVGYYDYGNFGDDLMAVVVARIVSAAGAHPSVLAANRRFEDYGLDVTPDPAALADSCDAIVLGGGGALLSPAADRPGSPSGRYSELLARVAVASTQTGTPLYAVSIGGDGAQRPLRAGVEKFLKAPNFRQATVRLRDDVAGLARLGVPATYFPDIVLSAREFLPEIARVSPLTATAPMSRGRLGLQSDSKRTICRLARLARRGSAPPLVRIYPSEADRHGDASALCEARGVEQFVARDIVETACMVAGLHAVIAARLHLGVLAAAMGVPFFLVEPQRKVLRFFEDLHLAPPTLPSGWLAARRIPALLADGGAWVHAPAFQSAIAASHGHVEFIQTQVCGG
jgi:polysaccharide pyruvyl transferase WcaK-like protein